MTKKSGSQGTDVLGVECVLVNGTITKRDAQKVIEHKLGVTDRQARASVSSYMAEGWPEPAQRDALAALNAPLCVPSSLEARLMMQADRRHDARVENVQKRSRK
jgi:hypothetical protein